MYPLSTGSILNLNFILFSNHFNSKQIFYQILLKNDFIMLYINFYVIIFNTLYIMCIVLLVVAVLCLNIHQQQLPNDNFDVGGDVCGRAPSAIRIYADRMSFHNRGEKSTRALRDISMISSPIVHAERKNLNQRSTCINHALQCANAQIIQVLIKGLRTSFAHYLQL